MAFKLRKKYRVGKCHTLPKRVFYLLNFLLFNLCTAAQIPTLNSALDKYKILIGEPITLRVEASYPSTLYNIQWFSIQDSAAHFEVVERKKADTIESGGQIKVSQSIIITSFDSGLKTLPALQVNFNPVNNSPPVSILTDSFKVQVTYSPADSVLPFHDIKTIISVKDEWPLWMKIAAVLTAILIIYLIYILLKKRKTKQPDKPVISKLSPVEEAMQSLDKLEKSELLTSGRTKEFHTSLTEIFKRYISRKLEEPVDHLTSDELLLLLKGKQISRDALTSIANTLKMADAVKFARFQPEEADSNGSLLNIRQVITDFDSQQFKTKGDN
jgi:hypothetical protein